MKTRRYCDSDHEKVSALVNESLPRDLPKRLGGCGVVIEEGDEIVAFCWALASPDSDIACVEFFAVSKSKRDNKVYGPLVITNLLIELKRMGVKEIIGLLCDGEEYTESLVRIYHDVGMVANRGYVVNGNVSTILEGIARRYGGNK